jgi:hypothetical protein
MFFRCYVVYKGILNRIFKCGGSHIEHLKKPDKDDLMLLDISMHMSFLATKALHPKSLTISFQISNL